VRGRVIHETQYTTLLNMVKEYGMKCGIICMVD